MNTEAVTMTGKLGEIAAIYGVSTAELLEQYHLDEVVPGICMNAGCDFTTLYEPDQKEGWCEECQTRTVTSALILGGIL
jgi:hypothetical protein